MDDSDDYIPNAEDNLSILSDADKSSGHSEIDLEEINDVLLQNLESDICGMQNEVKRRDCEMQNLIEDIKKRFYAEKDAEYAPIIRKYERKLHDLQEKNYELEESLKYEKSQSAKYLAVVDTLESECEKLRLETSKQQGEIFALNDKIHKINIAALNRSTANSSIMQNGPPSPIAAQPSGFNKNFIADRSRNMVLDTQEDYSVDFDATGFLKLDNFNKETEEVWNSKLDFYKEKLTNEQNRSRELEFMIATQKNLLESTNENIAKLKQELKQLESKNDKLSSEIDKVEQSKKIEKTKIDSVITFCELMDNCVFPKAEMLEKLSELPCMIASYLKGLTDTITFNRSQNSNSKLLVAAKKVKATLISLEEGNEKADRNYRAGLAANELDEIRHGISSLTQFLSKALPNTVANQDNAGGESPSDSSFSKMEKFKFSSKNDRQYQEMGRPNNFKTSYLFAKAMQSSSLLWNLNQQRASTRGSSEGH